MTGFVGQVAVITGASSGIGKAIALRLAKEGADLCLIGRNIAALEEVGKTAGKGVGEIGCYQADLSIEEDITGLSNRILRDRGHIDILIHSAGVISQGEIQFSSVQDLDWQYSINVRAPYMLTKAFLPTLINRCGEIVFINSSMGLTSRPKVGQYAATKFALKAFADSIREEVNPHGVRVLSVFLGRTASPMQAAVHDYEGKLYVPERLIQPEDVAGIVLSSLSLPRTAEVVEIRVRPFLKH